MFSLVNVYSLPSFILYLSISNSLVSSEETPSVSLKYGNIEGIEDESLNGNIFSSFLGIPFARPPVGELRFENPVEVEPWDGVLNATENPHACMQYDLIGTFVQPDNNQLGGKEDCLYLNVHTPQVSSTAKLTVMVFIHGGGWVNGAAGLYPPHVLLDENIVLVVIQYRLGVFGFLSTGDDVLPGNLGLKDQTFALKWIQENIAQFGGDPDRVTIFGESAGAGSVHLHMLSPLSTGLFHRAILQSGTAFCPWANVNNQRDLAVQLAELTDCSLDWHFPFICGSFKDCLKNVDAALLYQGLAESYKFGMEPLLTSPRIDGEFLEADPVTLMKNGKYNKVNVIQGITRDEGALFSAFIFAGAKTMQSFRENYTESAAYSLFMETEDDGSILAKKAFDFYIKDKPIEESFAELSKVFSACMFEVCHDINSMFLAKQEDLDFYRYELLHRGEKSILDIFQMDPTKKWITHVDDLIYLFHGGPFFDPFSISSEEDLKIRSMIVKLWTEFAKTGNPSANDLGFEWNPTTGTELNYLGLQTSPIMMNDTRQKMREFWFSLNTRQNKKLFPYGGTDIFYEDDVKGEL